MMQYLDWVSFREIGPILTLNVGGIANCQLAHRDRAKMMAFDTGPGNVMMDHVMRSRRGKSYDKDGELARAGMVDDALMTNSRSMISSSDRFRAAPGGSILDHPTWT